MVITSINSRVFTAKKPKDFATNPDNLQDFEKLLAAHGGSTHIETKYDGYGIIIDTRGKNPFLRSLSGEVWSTKPIPELEEDIHHLPNGLYVGEIVGRPTKAGFNARDEFAAVKTRGPFSKQAIKEHAQLSEFPLDLRIYDVLEHKGKDLANQHFEGRKKRLEDICATRRHTHHVEYETIQDPMQLQEKTKEQFAKGLEGFIIKRPGSRYCIEKRKSGLVGVRNIDWIKVKESLSVDLVVLGLRLKEGRYAQGWPCSNLLAGTYNEQTNRFETTTIVNIGSKKLAEEFYAKIAPLCEFSYNQAKPHTWQNQGRAPKRSLDVVYSIQLERGMPKDKVPFMYVQNPRDAPVIEVKAKAITSPRSTWHSCGTQDAPFQGHSLQQAKYIGLRKDKNALMATTTKQIRDMYNGL